MVRGIKNLWTTWDKKRGEVVLHLQRGNDKNKQKVLLNEICWGDGSVETYLFDGWSDFVTANDLHVGDRILFTIVNYVEMIYRVRIWRDDIEITGGSVSVGHDPHFNFQFLHSYVFKPTIVGYSAPTQSAIREDLNLSIAQYSTFGSILTIGAMVGAITSGRISDFIGRKWAMRMSACSCIMGWLAIYFAKGAMTLDIGRLFSGYGIGVLSYLVPIFIAEIAPKELRGGLTTLNQLMIVTGSSVSFLIGSIITWRALALMGLVPCIALLSGLFFVPESPRWLAKAGRQKEFKVALRMLRGQNADISREAAEIEDCLMLLETLPKGSFIDVFQSKYIRSVIIGVGLMVFQQSVGINGIGFYVSQTFVQAGLSSGKLGTIAYGIVQVPITLVGAILMDRSGRKPLVTISAMGTFLGCFFIATGFLLKSYGLLLEWIPLFVVGGVLTYISAFSIGFGGVPWVIMSEIFPLNVKGAAGSLVVLINWSGAWLVSYTYNFMMKWSASGTYNIYAGFCILTVLFVANFVPETKGKTLEEIQESINSKTETLE